jgi:glycosyltransferase involved in cell wall biosynthesis
MVICLDRIGPAAKWLLPDVHTVELQKASGNDRKVVKQLARVLREERIDIVQSHNWGTLVETVLARKQTGVAAHVHAERGTVLGSVTHRGLRQFLRAWAMRWALNRVDAVVSNAAAVAERVEQRCGFSADLIQLIPNGVESPSTDDLLTPRKEFRESLGIAERSFVLGSVGRLHEVKGFDLAIKAVSQLVESGHDAHLILVGDGPQRPYLQQEAERNDVAQRVHLVGQRDDVWRCLASLDVYVNTSHSEGLSQSLTEALAIGLPLVVTNVGDNASIVGMEDEACGIVLPRGEVSRLVESLGKLALDHQLRHCYSQRARSRFELRYTAARMVERFESLYRKLLARTNGTANQSNERESVGAGRAATL